ncbi:uncharacterized protein LOC127879106 isoform X2 [Dreissena polymorpha]|uniref:uncharacterized protein LOC127879106 isoform X2 n=1 Tax=Dreissena polymorpha TaxID=45954 RepID=UPI002263EE8F|nr:uncharacterized protein LOC127879106 isoform X2 [Dreissena polymorpha]
MDKQVLDDIQDIMKINRSNFQRLQDLNECGRRAECQCADVIDRLTAVASDLNERLTELHLRESEVDTEQNDIVQRFSYIETQLDELRQKVHTTKDISCNTVFAHNSKDGTYRDVSSKDSSVPKHGSSNVHTTTTRSVVRQTHKYFLSGNEKTWDTLAQKTLDRARQITGQLECVATVLCLDISESMASGNAWNQAMEFVNDFLSGLEEYKIHNEDRIREFVALVTFGHETKLQQCLTNRFDDVKKQLEQMPLGGPSPLLGGLMCAKAGALSGKNGPSVNGLIIIQKIIVVTDGRPTETLLHAGPDAEDETKHEQTLTYLAEAIDEIDKKDIDVSFIGVGNYDKNFINIMASLSGELKSFTYKDGRRLARRGYLAANLLFQDLSLNVTLNTAMTKEDEEDIQALRDRTERFMERDFGSKFYKEIKGSEIPILGSRVRRGPDWNRGNLDGNRPGTVIGHIESDQILVLWDFNDWKMVCRYGDAGFDVKVVNEPRILDEGENFAIGCRVKPKSDMSVEHNLSETGVVLQVADNKARVRWNDGTIRDYEYGIERKIAIELC